MSIMQIQGNNHRHLSTTIVILVISGVSFCCSTSSAGNNDKAIIQFLPAQPANGTSYPPHVQIVDNKFILDGAPARLWFELYISNWSAFGLVCNVQVTLDADSYTNESGIDLILPAVDCISHDDCETSLGPGSECAGPGDPPNFCGDNCCRPGFQDTEQMNWVDADCITARSIGIMGVNTSTTAITWGHGGFSCNHKADCGDLYYSGTFAVDVPVNAVGTYHFDINLAYSTMTNSRGEAIPFDYIAPAIEIPLVQCCDRDFNCVADGITISQCHDIDPDNFYHLDKTCAEACVCPSDIDGDGTCDFADQCPFDPNKIEPGICGCGVDDTIDENNDGVPDCLQVIMVPTVSHWGILILMLSLFIMITLKFRRTPIHS